MTEPHGPRRPIPPGGADAAITTGRRVLRRRRATAAGAGASLAALAVVAVTAGGAAGPSSLRPAGRDPLPTTLPPVSGTPALPTALPTGLPLPAGSATPSPTAEPEPSPESATPSPSPSATEERRWVGHGPGGVTYRHGDPEPMTCPKAPGAPANGFCTYALGPATVTPGERVALTLKLCRATSATATEVAYRDVNAPLVWVGRFDDAGETVVWRRRSAADPAPFSRPYAAGDCDTWTVGWLGQDADGYALPPGEYQVNIAVPTADWGNPEPPPAFYTVRVTD
ncbi:MAG TPA: hypothetical protein VNA20_00455 [Frankiaceae bacterium]|nr:hypothetical protein [Frankiaceae bacterium]